MYISRVKINSGSTDTVKLLMKLQKDAYAGHRLIWQLFPDQPEASRDFLFRQEFEAEQCPASGSRKGMPIFYVVSKREPLPVPGLFSVLTKAYNPKLSKGMKLGFILRANPVVSRPQEGKKNSVKHDVLMDAKARAKLANIPAKEIWSVMRQSAIDWLIRKSNDFGFKIIGNEGNLLVEPYSYRQHRLYKPKGKQEIKFSSIDFRGALMISNPDSFYKALFEGIGKSKSFGCGLMMVRRI
jgi:CRISPR system Cascade subunit CasE